MHLRLLRSFSNSSNISSTMLLAVTGAYTTRVCYSYIRLNTTFAIISLQNPDIVLVHYLNVPYPDDNKMAVITPSLALWGDKKEWTKEELVCQLKPMCKFRSISCLWIIVIIFITISFSVVHRRNAVFSEDEPDATNEIEITVSIGHPLHRWTVLD